MTDAVLQIESVGAEAAGAVDAQSEAGASQIVGLNVLSIPRRAREVHDELTSTSLEARIAFYDKCPLWDADTRKQLRPVVEYSVSRIRPREAWAAVASQIQQELNVLWTGITLILSVISATIIWRHGAFVWLVPMVVVALCTCLATLLWNVVLMTRRTRWKAMLCCLVLGAALPAWLAYVIGNHPGRALWLSDGVRTGLLAGAIGALGLLIINGAYALFALAIWRRKCAVYPVEELIDSLLYMLEGIDQRRSQSAGSDDDARYHAALHYSFGLDLADTLEYTALVAENEWQRMMVRAHPPAQSWFAERAAAMAGALRSWKPYVVFNDDRLDDLSADLALAVTAIASGDYAAVCSSDGCITERETKRTRPRIIRAAASLVLPLVVAATVLQSNVAPAVAGSVVSLCLAFPLIQLLQMLDPKSGDKLASAIDVTRVFRPSS